LLPTSASSTIGDTFQIVGYGNLWTLQQNALQSITLGRSTSTVGILGSLTATHIRDTVELLYVAVDEWQIIDSIGNLTIA